MKLNYLLRLSSITLMIVLMSLNLTIGQTHILCGTDIMTQKLLNEHPELLEEYTKSETYTQNYVKILEAQKAAKKASHKISANAPTVYIIPIVFHILEQEGPENISDAQVMSEMKILNEDWGHTNPDTGYAATSHFKSIEGNMQVQFRLAQIDPHGNCTNGIDRIYTNLTNQANDLSKINQWDPYKYLNVWVCKSINSGAISGGTTLGYAYFPFEINNNPTIDGVLITDFCIGTIGTALTNGGLGGTPGQFCRCLSHEIGHVMNLEHPWGLTNSPNVTGKYKYALAADLCGDDGVNDTPLTEGYFSYCPTGGGNTQTGLPTIADTLYGEICDTTSKSPLHIITENFQNFMDYSECSMMFTQGQQERVWATLNSSLGGRNNLWDTANLIATGVYTAPLAECVPNANFYSNTCFICEGSSVNFIDNTSNATPTSWDWTFTGATISTSTQQNPVVTFNTPYYQTVSLTASDSVGGTTQTQTNYIYVSPSWSYYVGSYSEGFENSSEVNDNWLFYNKFNNGIRWQTTNAAASTGNGSLMLNSYQHVVYNYECVPPCVLVPAAGAFAIWDAITPSVDLGNATALTFSFDYSCATEATTPSAITDTLEMAYSLDCGTTWKNFRYILGTALTNAGMYATFYTPSTPSDWASISIPVPAGADNKPNVRFRFRYVSGLYSNNIYIDNVNLTGTLGTDIISSGEDHLLVYPNPMSTTVTISYYLPMDQQVNIGLYDITGRQLKEIAHTNQVAGQHTIDLQDDNLSNGVYFIKMVSGNSTIVTKKLIVIR